MHIAVGKESKEIVAMGVTRHVPDGKKMIAMLKSVDEKYCDQSDSKWS